MTNSTHTYSAVLKGTPDQPLAVRGGRVRLDSGGWPHVTAQLEIAVPDEALLDELDSRQLKRVVITADAVFPDKVQTRSFDLGLRARDGGQVDGYVTLDLASDEARLVDLAPLVTDTSQQSETSLRDLVNYVLAKIDATLEASPANDADVTAFWPVTNLVIDPNGVDAAHSATGAGASTQTAVTFLGVDALRWTASAATSGIYPGTWDANAGALKRVRVTPGRSYVASVRLASSIARNATVAIQFRDEAGTAVIRTVTSAAVLTATGSYVQLGVVGVAPRGASYATVFVNTTGNTVGQFHYVRRVMLYEGDRVVPDFDGGTADDVGYTYEWEGDPNLSPSTRTPIVDRPLEALTWRAGISALEFLHPLVQAAGLRLVCDEERKWTLRSSSYVAPGSLSAAYGVDLIDARDRLSRDDETWFDGQVTVYTSRDEYGNTIEAVDSFALVGATKIIRVDVDAPWPGNGRSEYAVRRAQGRGREVDATKVADWWARAEQPIIVTMTGAPDQVGLTESVEFDLNRDEVTVTTRTMDAVEGSIDLLAGMIDALPGMIDSL